MGKKNRDEVNVYYLCPHCGNDAPYFMKDDKPWYCHYCKQPYMKNDRVKEKK